MMLFWQRRGYSLRRETSLADLSWLVLIPLTMLFVALLAACGGSNAPSSPGVSVLDNDFSPKELHIKAGQTVTWVNNGQTVHTVTADDNSFDSGDFGPGKRFAHTFTRPGRYPYFCQLHGAAGGLGMAGVVIVGGTSGVSSNDAGYNDTVSASSHRAPRTAPLALLRVPEDYPTIQSAVNAARAGDLVSIAPGVYHEAVTVKTPDLTIRGRDRNTVILDGEFRRDDGFEVLADNVIVENMTARHYVGNGFYWTGVKGFRGSYLTAYANGDYGLYAYGSNTGQFDHDFAAGHPDSGFYIGYCHPCRAVIADVISEGNSLGYSGTNAGGDLIIRDSIWRNNMGGIVPNTLDSEPDPPEDGTTIMHNLVENNNNYNAPTEIYGYPTIGNGIVIAGGNNNVITDNTVNGHIYYGILIVPNIDKNLWEPGGNIVEHNTITRSGIADLALSALSARDNCFSNNTASRTVPPLLQFTHACGSLSAYAGGGDPSVSVVLLNHLAQITLHRFTSRNWKTQSLPPDFHQPGMPDPNAGLQGIFTSVEGTLNMTATATSIAPALTLAGLGLTSPFFEILLGFYTYYLPLALYAAWLSIATWDIVRRGQLQGGSRIGWMAVIYLIPILGPIAYYLFGKSEIPRSTRIALVVGAPIIYLVVAVLLLLFVS
jgi:plastocyanin